MGRVMEHRRSQRDTIAALATPPGRSALAVVRIAGPRSLDVLRAVFVPKHRSSIPPRRPVLGRFFGRDGQVIDEGIAVVLPGPESYTGDDVVELTTHGSPPVVDEIVRSCVEAGARGAEPGEFTMRALELGKIDLTRAEAVRDLVEAATLEQARVAARQLGGEVSGTVGPLADRVVDLLADVEAGLDFAEEERGLAAPGAELAARCSRIMEEIDRLSRASESARRVREGARVVLAGPPNAGKSSLFNALLGEDRVIVTEEPGTTRDLVEETLVLEGLPVVLVDAAGIGPAAGRAEELGMERALSAASDAHLVLDVYDLTGSHRPAGRESAGRHLPVGTHADLPYDLPPSDGSVVVSSKTGEGLESLRREVATSLRAPGSVPLESVALATARHLEAAVAARRSLEAARTILAAERDEPELAAVELRAAVASLRSVVGEVDAEELLGRIFSRFCIGK